MEERYLPVKGGGDGGGGGGGVCMCVWLLVGCGAQCVVYWGNNQLHRFFLCVGKEEGV